MVRRLRKRSARTPPWSEKNREGRKRMAMVRPRATGDLVRAENEPTEDEILHPGAGQRDQLSEPEEPVVAVAERAECVEEAGHQARLYPRPTAPPRPCAGPAPPRRSHPRDGGSGPEPNRRPGRYLAPAAASASARIAEESSGAAARRPPAATPRRGRNWAGRPGPRPEGPPPPAPPPGPHRSPTPRCRPPQMACAKAGASSDATVISRLPDPMRPSGSRPRRSQIRAVCG